MPDKTGGKQGRKAGRYRKGESGNPAGRPPGARNRSTAILQGLLEEDGPEVVRKLLKRAKAGHAMSVRLVIERLLPRAERQTRVDVAVPGLGRAGDIVEALSVVLQAVSAGEMSLEEAAGFCRILEGQRKAIETADLAVRIEALEGADNAVTK